MRNREAKCAGNVSGGLPFALIRSINEKMKPSTCYLSREVLEGVSQEVAPLLSFIWSISSPNCHGCLENLSC